MASAMTSKVIKGQIKRFTHYLIRLLPYQTSLPLDKAVSNGGPGICTLCRPCRKTFFCNLQNSKEYKNQISYVETMILIKLSL